MLPAVDDLRRAILPELDRIEAAATEAAADLRERLDAIRAVLRGPAPPAPPTLPGMEPIARTGTGDRKPLSNTDP